MILKIVMILNTLLGGLVDCFVTVSSVLSDRYFLALVYKDILENAFVKNRCNFRCGISIKIVGFFCVLFTNELARENRFDLLGLYRFSK